MEARSKGFAALFMWLMFAMGTLPLYSAGLPKAIRIDREATRFFQRTDGWVAGDGAISIPLSFDGGLKVLWLFGDSHLDDLDLKSGTTACLFQCRNAGLLQDGLEFLSARTLEGTGPGFRSWLKQGTNDAEWFWPVCGFQQGKDAFIYLAALRKTAAGGAWGFESSGHDSFAKVRLPDFTKIEFLPLASFGGIGFGQGFVREGEFMYAFGSKGHKLGSDLFLARFKPEQPVANWSFWDGTQWAPDVSKCVPIGHGTSTSVHVCKVRDRFVLLTSDFSVGCDQGKAINVSTSRLATGPFSTPRKLCDIPDRYKGHTPFFYFPILHPEFINAQNEILLTYSINNYAPCVPDCVKGRAIAEHYRPKALRVKLENLLRDAEAEKRSR